MQINAIKGITKVMAGLFAAASVALVPMGHAFALTDVQDYAYEGNGQGLSYCSEAVGTIVYFGDGCTTEWQAQLEVTTGGKSYYAWHPYGDTGACMTASTTQEGVIKIEACTDGPGSYPVSQQLWWNPECALTDYHLINGWWQEDLYETGGENGNGTNFTTQNACGVNGETFQQIS